MSRRHRTCDSSISAMQVAQIAFTGAVLSGLVLDLAGQAGATTDAEQDQVAHVGATTTAAELDPAKISANPDGTRVYVPGNTNMPPAGFVVGQRPDPANPAVMQRVFIPIAPDLLAAPNLVLPAESAPNLVSPAESAPNLVLPAESAPNLVLPAESAPNLVLPAGSAPNLVLPAGSAPGPLAPVGGIPAPTPETDLATQTVSAKLPMPAETPHLSSPEHLPPGTTEQAPANSNQPNLTYIRELWHAVKSQEISGNDALVMALSQRPMNTPEEPQAGPANPNTPLVPEAGAPPLYAEQPLTPTPVPPLA